MKIAPAASQMVHGLRPPARVVVRPVVWINGTPCPIVSDVSITLHTPPLPNYGFAWTGAKHVPMVPES